MEARYGRSAATKVREGRRTDQGLFSRGETNHGVSVYVERFLAGFSAFLSPVPAVGNPQSVAYHGTLSEDFSLKFR
jgi:hypothetical protein